MTVLTGARVVTPSAILDPGWVEITDGRITDVGAGAPPAGASPATASPAGASPAGAESVTGWLLPGFIDLHVHGGGGHDFTASPQDMAAGVEFHRRNGTTRTLVSLMAGPIDRMCEQLSWVADLTSSGHVAGAHLEGPFLALARCGAQNHEHLLPPDALVLAKLLEAARGSVRTMTVAPELPGALSVIEDIVAAGAVAAIGHTDATYEQAKDAFAAGATLTTHLFNALGSISQRAPGPSVAALDSGVYVELINDGVHMHESLVRLAATTSPDRLALITDAISATGVGDGRYSLGDQAVVVENGMARLDASDQLAGSTLTMSKSVRRAVQSVGLPIELAAAAASTNPARLLGLADRCGSIAPGLDADLVLLDDELRVQRVMVRGAWL